VKPDGEGRIDDDDNDDDDDDDDDKFVCALYICKNIPKCFIYH